MDGLGVFFLCVLGWRDGEIEVGKEYEVRLNKYH